MWHDHLEEEVKRLYPNYESAEQEFIQSIDFDAAHDPEATVFKIPVVVHIIMTMREITLAISR